MSNYVFWTNGMLYMALSLKRQYDPTAPYVAVSEKEWNDYYDAVKRSLTAERDLQYDFNFEIRRGQPDDMGVNIRDPRQRREALRANFHFDPKRRIYWTQSDLDHLFNKAKLITPAAATGHLMPKGYENILHLDIGPSKTN